MESKQLMIGDYVQTIREGIIYYGRVISLYEGRAIAKCIDSELTFEDEMEYVPLTEEILKANGFTLYSDEYEGVYKICSFLAQISTCADIVTTYDHDIIFECAFVHELQHTLHMCGLRELADNFKLKEDKI